jgi:hypothetical protein
LKLLGADQYERIRMAAAERARDAASRVTQLDAQLGDLADATPDAALAASARVDELDALRLATDERLAAISTLRDAALADARRRDELQGHADRLAAVAAPDGVADLSERADALSSALEAALAAESDAADLWDAARRILELAGPRREWERLADQWRESADLAERLPGLRQQAEAAVAASTAARDRRDETSAAVSATEQGTEPASARCRAAHVVGREPPNADGVTTRRVATWQFAAAQQMQRRRTNCGRRAEAASAGDVPQAPALAWLAQQRDLVRNSPGLDVAVASAKPWRPAHRADVSDRAVTDAEQRNPRAGWRLRHLRWVTTARVRTRVIRPPAATAVSPRRRPL